MHECYIAIIIAYADLVENGGVSPHLSREWSATVQLSIGEGRGREVMQLLRDVKYNTVHAIIGTLYYWVSDSLPCLDL